MSVLIIGGLSHLLAPSELRDALRRQAVLPDRLVHPLATLVISAETGIGAIGLTILLGGWKTRELGSTSLIAAGILYLSYGTYALFLLLRRHGAPCGCGPIDHPTNIWVVGRAAALVIASIVGATQSGEVMNLSRPGFDLAISLAASLAFAAIVWNLPAAMQAPAIGLSSTRRLAE